MIVILTIIGAKPTNLKYFKGTHNIPKTLASFFSEVLVMNLMSPTYCLGIAIIRFSKDFKTLVDEDIVHQNK